MGENYGITEEVFKKACALNTDAGTGAAHYALFVGSMSAATIGDQHEAAKYLAHICWESTGLTQMREQAALKKENEKEVTAKYGSGPGGVIYYGRGPLQLRGANNYKEASIFLFEDENVLVNDPDMIITDLQAGWDAAAWFWETQVHANRDTFQTSLKCINPEEVPGGKQERYFQDRFDHYAKICELLGVKAK